MNNKIENDQRVKKVVDLVPCKKHDAPVGSPCWRVFQTTQNGYFAAICNSRIRRAGYKGKISPSSLSQKSSRPNARARS